MQVVCDMSDLINNRSSGYASFNYGKKLAYIYYRIYMLSLYYYSLHSYYCYRYIEDCGTKKSDLVKVEIALNNEV